MSGSIAEFKKRTIIPQHKQTSKRLIKRIMALQQAEGTSDTPTEEEVIQYNIDHYVANNDPQFRYCKRIFDEVNPTDQNLEQIFGVDPVSDASLFEAGKQS